MVEQGCDAFDHDLIETFKMKVAFLDRDGVINHDYGYVYNIAQFDFIDGVFEACRLLRRHGYEIVVVTNQSGIARGYYTPTQLADLHSWMALCFANQGIDIAKIYHCPHHLEGKITKYVIPCNCRKPRPGMLLDAATALNITLDESILFGDKESDIQAGKAAGLKHLIKLGEANQTQADIVCRSLLDGVEKVLSP
jgi:D-glycero-D-manno-heptose 1,7-bisphosphate phosphatase